MTNSTDTLASPVELEAVGNVASNYRHVSKLINPGPGLALGDAYVKWYEIAQPEDGMPDEIHALARNYLYAEATSQNLSLAGELGFVILHRCGESFYFLIVCTWRNENEVWETVYAKANEAAGFQPFTRKGPHIPTYCVWELGAVWHEKLAWSRYLMSPRDTVAKQSYLQDSYEGPV
jgi:hypothetical protein